MLDDPDETNTIQLVGDERRRLSDEQRPDASAGALPRRARVDRRRRSRTTARSTRSEALEAGLVFSAPDDIDWDDEVRMAIEERAAFSPDALTGMEANLRFAGPETMETKIFGRLTAWQNWIFQRPNAVGEKRRAHDLRPRGPAALSIAKTDVAMISMSE